MTTTQLKPRTIVERARRVLRRLAVHARYESRRFRGASKTSSILLLSELYPEFEIGRGSYGDLKIRSFGENTTFSMGSWCSVARGAQVMLGGGHRTDWVTTYPFTATCAAAVDIAGHPVSRGSVRIGNDVWIGSDALIMSGVSIGDGAAIGARALVTRDVPAYGVVVGSPGRVIKYRFERDIIERLLRVRWWDWEEPRVQRALPYLLSSDIEKFLSLCEQNVL